MFCVDKKPTQPVPQIPFSYLFSQEITGNTNEFETTLTRILRDVYVYDNLITYKYRNHVAEEATNNSTEPHQYIVDRGLGVQYSINMNSGSCRVRGLERYQTPGGPDDPFNVALDYIAHFEEWSSILPPSGHFVYNGDRKFNGIESERFIDKVNISNETSNIYEYSFSKVYL